MIRITGAYYRFTIKADSFAIFSELDPFAGKWIGLSPEKGADRAINEIMMLCLAFFYRRWRENILNSYYKGPCHVNFLTDNTIIL